MVLIAIVLGVGFAWLVETTWVWFLDRLGSEPWRDWARAIRNFAGYLLVLGLVPTAIYIVACDFYGRYVAADLASQSIWIDFFVTLPSSLSALIGFAIGAAIFWLRRKIKKFYGDAIAAVRSPQQEARGAPQPAAARRSAQPHDGGAKAAYSWLTGIVGIAAVTMLAIITLVIFFPEVLTRVESIKVAGIEARFASSASNSIRITAQAETSPSGATFNIGGWSGVEKTLKEIVEPVRLIFLADAKASPEQSNKSQAKKEQVQNFLKAVAVPLAEAVGCYSKDFPNVRDTIMQGRIAPIASDWARFAIRVLQDKTLSDQDGELAFNQLIKDLYETVDFVNADLMKRQSRCGLSSKDELYAATAVDRKLMDGMAKNLPEIFSNGYVIAYIANMIMFTQTPGQAIEFMNSVELYLDPDDDAATGRYNFYYRRADARYYSDSWSVKEWRSDVTRAKALANKIAKAGAGPGKSAIVPSAERLERYYLALVARTNNSLVYGDVRYWLEGHRISPLALADAKKLIEELEEWLRAQSYTALLNNKAEFGALSRVISIANIYDTLALYELMVGATRSELTKDRCAKGWALLNASKDVWDALVPKLIEMGAQSAHRGAIKIYEAHASLYQNACPI